MGVNIVWKLFFLVLIISISVLGYGIYSLMSARSALDQAPPAFSYGPENADLHVVGFFQYSCVHCREVYPVIMDAVKKDGKIRFTPLMLYGEGDSSARITRLTYA